MGSTSPADLRGSLKRARLPGARSLIFVGGILAILALALWGVPQWFGSNEYKPRFEAAASGALGLRVRVGGRLRVGLLPAPHISVEDGHVEDAHGVDVASARRTRFWLRWLPLLRGQLRLRRFELVEPHFTIARDPGGPLNIKPLEHAIALLGAFDGAGLSIKNGSLRCVDRNARTSVEFDGVELDASDVQLAAPQGTPAMGRVSLKAKLRCREVRSQTFAASALDATVNGRNGILEFKPVTLRLLGGQAAGSLRADPSADAPTYHLRCELPEFRAEQLFAKPSPGSTQPTASGPMALTADLSVSGRTRLDLVQSATGTVSLHGAHLRLVGSDIDGSLARFASNQNLNLFDVGAVFLAGPLGVAATRGYSFVGLFGGSGGTSDIETVVSNWQVSRGVAEAHDVALATRKSRLALRGELDFVNARFSNMTVAAVDAGGCAIVRQAIRGPFGKPVVEKPHVLTVVAGPVLGLLRKARKLLPEQPCEVFYSGSVPPPR